jgi:two-component system response regulator QseB
MYERKPRAGFSRKAASAENMRVLLVEDDPMIGASVQKGLRQDGFSVDWVRDSTAAETALHANPYDSLLLDLGLPGRGGDVFLRSLRRSGNSIPVLVITARDAVSERVAALDNGADDYVLKPFDLDELAARIRAVRRRYVGRAEQVLRVGAVELDAAAHQVTVEGRAVALSARELSLLEALMERPRAVLSRAQLEERIYGWGEEIESNAVEVYIHSLRKKLGTRFIRTIRGVGYTVQPADNVHTA